MTKKDIIERLCKLSSKVGNTLFESKYAYDCFCNQKNNQNRFNFQFDEKVINFIEITVLKEINRQLKK